MRRSKKAKLSGTRPAVRAKKKARREGQPAAVAKKARGCVDCRSYDCSLCEKTGQHVARKKPVCRKFRWR